jgi:protein-tyrosine phosphatase
VSVPAKKGGFLSAVGFLTTLLVIVTRRLPWPGSRPTLAWITPSLAQGPRFTRAQVGALARSGVTSVLDVRQEAHDEEALLARCGLRFCHVPMTDRAPPSQRQLKRAVEWVMGELADDGKVFIHCHSGVGRSVCVACAVLVRMGYSLPQAYDAVRRRRPEAVISDEQVEALRRYAESLSPRPAP